MNRLKGIIYDIISLLATLGTRKKTSNKKILIVRVDEIGDFILWHKFLQDIVSSEQYKGYIFHFCGNQSWKSLFTHFDAALVNKSFWLDKIRFKKEMWYRYKFLKQIYREGYAVVINPTFSRDKRYDDSIVRAAKAPQRIGMVANLESIRSYETGYDRSLYTRLFNHAGKPIFEFYRNKYFSEFIIDCDSAVSDTKLSTDLLPAFHMALPEKYFIVFPGSRSKSRIWPTENFVLVSNYLFEHYRWTAVVCGTDSDSDYTQAFCKQYTNPSLNLTGKTSLLDMLTLFTKAQCLLSVDTGSVHMAAAVGCRVFGIFNGSQYKRFSPYPLALSDHFHALYPDEIEIELKEENLVKQKYEFVVDIPYSSVKAEKLIHAIYEQYEGK